MEFSILYIVVIVIGYMLGSLNMSLIIGKIYKIDVRKHGSGNAGATNTLRTLGMIPALLTTLGDILKGIFSCLIGYYLIGDSFNEVGLILGGFGAILGHNWPIYFSFKGGKGVSTTFAVIIMMDWKIAISLLVIFVLVVALTRVVSLGSVVVAILFPIISMIGVYGEKSTFFIISTIFLAALVITRHGGNIKRILSGTESKLGSKK